MRRHRESRFFYHNHGVGGVNDFEGLYAFDPRALDRDLAIIFTGDHTGVDPVDAAVAGNDAAFEIDGWQLIDEAVLSRAELLAGGPVDLLEEPPVTDLVDHFAALIGRAQHNDPAKVWQGLGGPDLPDNDAAERVGDEMDRSRDFRPGLNATAEIFGEGWDVVVSRIVAQVEGAVAGGLKGLVHPVHRFGGTGQSMKQDDGVLGGQWYGHEQEE